ncbi:MAG: bifunctional protein-serine/threonine kinase/phosphatase [Gammaproteobacteria bacterium]|nr:bifunctional protein-serine/threonine kinase/phosphatase [Gammaproteobacteria bacterium]
MGMQVDVGSASQTGRRTRNEDALAVAVPEARDLVAKGFAFALADGVGGADNGGEAAHCSVHGVIADYYATPDTWEIAFALDRVITAQNRWLRAQRGGGQGALATTLSMLVLRGQRYCVAHVGDTRIYRLRGDRLECLTQDHVWDQRGMEHVLTRALGLDQGILVDFAEDTLAEGDCFILLCDGVWACLPDSRIRQIVQRVEPAQTRAEALVEAALAAGSDDNVSAVVVDLLRLPPAGLTDTLGLSRDLPVPPRLRAGQHLDGLQIDAVLHTSRQSVLYRVRDVRGERWVLKTLPAELAGDDAVREALLLEEWLGKRLNAPQFAPVCPLGPEDRQHLYFLTRWYAGRTLAQTLTEGRRFSPDEVAQLGIQLAQGLSALHRLNILHRDIKPENLHWGEDRVLRILDLGVAWCPGIRERSLQDNPGTPSYLAPELFEGADASLSSEVYAAGVVLYHLLTGRYPYGEIEPFSHPRFQEPVAPTRYRPDVPRWLEALILRAVARDPRQRIETADELRLLLARGDAQALANLPRAPLAERNPLLLWQGLSAGLFLVNLLLIYVVLVS